MILYMYLNEIFFFELWFDMYDFGQSDYVLTLILINESYSLVLKLVLFGASRAYRIFGPS